MPSAEKIMQELETNQIILASIPSKTYNDTVTDIVETLSKKPLVYITLNKTADAVRETLTKKKSEMANITFIDAISRLVQAKPTRDENCYHISSPGALTELSLTLNKALSKKPEYVIFDNLTNLTIYQPKATVLKFVNSIVNKLRTTTTRTVFIVTDIAEQRGLNEEYGAYMDNQVTIKDR